MKLFGSLKKLILPFFPDNSWLRKHWWHRLSLIVSCLWASFWVLWALIFIYSYILTPTIKTFNNIELRKEIQSTIIKQNKHYDYESAYKNGYSYEEILQYINTGKQPVNTDWDRSLGYDKSNGTEFNTDPSQIIFPLILLAIGIFIPNLIYRVFLFVVTNNKWKQG